jgi:3-isopropylmalate/(R)-2-methylmalate dehydratase small subunit
MGANVYKLGADINTDVILPGKYLSVTNPDELASHCMEGLDPEFSSKIKRGDVIFAGSNFGCGSSREHAVIAIKSSGVAAVVAESFARIFYRSSINNGLPLLECPEAVRSTDPGDEVEVDPIQGLIHNKTRGLTFRTPPQPEFLRRVYAAGGLLPLIKSSFSISQK